MSDERKGTQYAQLFFEKGYENVFLLSGGFEQFVEDFNHLCEGVNVPKPKKIGKSCDNLFRDHTNQMCS